MVPNVSDSDSNDSERNRRRGDPEPPHESDPNRWPEGWPRLNVAPNPAATATQWVRFVGGSADGLGDRVPEIAPGELPLELERMGSTYRLVAVHAGRDFEYHVRDDMA